MADFDRESMLEMFTFEMSQLLEQLEQNIIKGENGYSMDEINEIFRIMHTIKGSAAMMMYTSISTAAHSIEDLFFYLREESPPNLDYSHLTDLVLEGMDFIKSELTKVENHSAADGDASVIIQMMKSFLAQIKGEAPKIEATPVVLEPVQIAESKHFKGFIKFEDGCEMENIRAYTLIHNLEDKVYDVRHNPEDIIDESSLDVIKNNGFHFEFSSRLSYEELYGILQSTIYMKELKFEEVQQSVEVVKEENKVVESAPTEKTEVQNKAETVKNTVDAVNASKKAQSSSPMISVNVSKLDQLLNLMGELVISEAMVTQNPELSGLELENFHREARHLHKIINDVQETVMTMRMVPLQSTFFKMHRIVRDMCKQLNKDVALEIVGEDTEVDKNIIEHIADPLMHIIRNSIDHGIEKPEDRKAKGKPEKGTVLLEAKNSGGDVLIIIKDDGAGLNKDAIMRKAKNNGLLKKAESEYSDKEIHQFIFLPGFSTNEKVTSFSGRGVGMDVVSTNLEAVRGTVLVDSVPGEGSTFTLKIPLTLAIIEGMTIKVGEAIYTIPIISIKQSFKARKEDLFFDPSGNEMITDRGEIYNIVRLYEFFGNDTPVTNIEDGIMIMLENGEQTVCLFADELLGEQQVVVKTIPKYIKNPRGISGCTLLGNGDISLIIDVAGFFDK